jgi:cell division septum initiation protein DivIVA
VTTRNKVLIAAGALVGVFLAALVVLPLLFKDRIAARAHGAIDRAVDAHVEWSGVGLSFFGDFPNLTFTLEHLTVVGKDRFAGDTLVAMKDLGLVLDLSSLIGGLRGRNPIRVRAIDLDEPAVHLRVLPDGTSNWHIGSGGTATGGSGASKGLSVQLSRLDVTDGRVVLENERSGLFASFAGVQHSLSGNLSKERLTVRTRTRADTSIVRFAGVPYLGGVALDFSADVDADMANERFTFADNELHLNGLTVNFSGSAAKSGKNVTLDVRFQAPRTEFAQILSLVPTVYAHDFESLQTSGTFSLQGSVHGDLGETALPAFALEAEVADGMFHYPDLPDSARDIGLHLTVDNPGGDVDSTVVDLDRFHASLGGAPLDAALTLRTPVSDPDVDFRVKGTLDLADVTRTVKLQGVQELKGVVSADAAVRARLSDVDHARYDRVAARGDVSAKDVTLKTETIPQPISVHEATLGLSPQRAQLKSLDAQIGGSDIQASGSLDNVLGFVLRHEELRGSATFASRRFILDEWKSSDSQLEVIPVPPGIDLTLDGTVDRLTYGNLEMADAKGKVHVKDQRVTLEDFTMRTLGGHIRVDGFYETTEPTKPTFGVGLALDSLDIGRASAVFLTIRSLAPVARFARGDFTAKLDLSGALGSDMVPVFGGLDGKGSLLTSKLALEGFPAMQRLADALSLPQLANPTFDAIRSSIEIRDGRLHVQPFHVKVGQLGMAVSGSNGVDQSLDYKLGLAIPRSVLGGGADRAVRDLVAKAGRAGLDLQAADSVEVAVGLTGTVADPSVKTDFGRLVSSTGQKLQEAAGAAVEQRVDAAKERADSAAEEARRRAQARADSILQDAQVRADTIRAAARKLADGVRAEGGRRADQLLAEARNPVARAAAKPVADRIRKEADDKAKGIVEEADKRADDLIAEARSRADAILKGG